MLKLRFKNNKHSAVWLVEPKVTIGRAASNDLVADDVDVADFHAEVFVERESLTLKNISADLPLFLNRKAVVKAVPIKAGDEISLGKLQLEVVDPKAEKRGSPTVIRSEGSTGWALKANHSALSNRVFPLKNLNVVGRANECDITLAAAHLSRRHAELLIKDELLYVKDLGSSNGTFLNGKQVTEARIKRGDELRFDTLSFGVIGPADEMDKTTVRSAASMNVRPEKTARSAPKKKAAVKATRPTVAPPVALEKESVEVESGGKALIVLGLLLIGVLGSLVWFQGSL